VCHGKNLPSNRKARDERQQRLARQQQDQAPLAAEPARAPLLGRQREPLDQAPRFQPALRTIDKNGIDVVLAELRARGEKV
jgi:hypothetical protein